MKGQAFGRGRKVPVAPVLRGPSREARPTPLRESRMHKFEGTGFRQGPTTSSGRRFWADGREVETDSPTVLLVRSKVGVI